ncbi:outer membrane protein [Legionella gresilensis]|uniref:outer membrane protein n=1 Tax=Legionella gresilensis TaxID=91823 RepID=UPI00104199FE|nr:outer membrane beta-barrel protein [Legionella gresilensis]
MMNLMIRFGIASAMLISSTAYAADPDNGWYAGFLVGGSYLEGIDLNLSKFPSLPFVTYIPQTTTVNPLFPLLSGLTVNSPTVTYKVGFNGGIAVGYRWCENYRFEGELNLAGNQIEKIQIPTIGAIRRHQNPYGLSLSGGTGMLAALFNAYYDFYTPGSDSSFVPYVGIGIGYAYFRTNFSLQQYGVYIGQSRVSGSTTAPVGQGIIGLSYFIDETISVGADFRYLTSNNINNFNGRVAIESLNFVMNFSFDQPEQAA